MPPRLTFSAISKQFGGYTALHPLSLTLEHGEILGFLGPNGAGKTTAIHLALGFLRPSSGSGSLLGRPFGDAEARSRLGFVADVPVFFSESGFRSVELAARLNGVSDPQLAREIRDLLGAVGLPQDEANARKDARQFSRGMQQRLALAQALINDPELLILDEPAAALDPAGVQQVRELLRKARHAGKSIFFSSHQLTEVEQICDRIAFLHQGRLLRCGSLKELQSESDRVEMELRGISVAEVNRIYPAIDAGINTGAATTGSNPGSIRISIPATEQRRVIEAVWSAGGELVSLSPMRRRLEELFIEWSSATPSQDSPGKASDPA
jgi:ABC-2 type transport system ATP-binding protein